MRGETVPGFGRRVESARLAKQMTQQQFGEHVGKPSTAAQTACWDWENKDRVPYEPEVRNRLFEVLAEHEGKTNGSPGNGPGTTDVQARDRIVEDAEAYRAARSAISQLKAFARSLGVEVTITLSFGR